MSFVNIRNLDLTLSEPETYLSANMSASSGSLTVKNISGFSINQILLIGVLGNQGSEIIKTSSSSAPSGSTITLASSTVFPHSSSTIISVMGYDQVEISTATTVSGSKSVLATISIVANAPSTNYNDLANSPGYYFARFKNSITSTFSGYSDPIPAAGYTQYAARHIIDNALGMINRSIGVTITDYYAFSQIDSCHMECIRELKRWSFLQKFNANIGQVTTGQWKVALPVDCDDQNSNRSIYNFRIGTGTNITWIDKEKWNDITQDVSHSTLANNININDTTVTLTSSSDFLSTGTAYVNGVGYNYSSNNQTTGVLTLSSASTTSATAGADVFQGATLGTPNVWTTFGGYIYFYPIIDPTLNQRNAYLDYYSALVSTTSDSQLTILPDPTVVEYYLAWKFLLKQANGQTNDEIDAMFEKFDKRKVKMIQKETANRTFQLRPLLNRFNMSSDDSESIRLGNFQTGF